MRSRRLSFLAPLALVGLAFVGLGGCLDDPNAPFGAEPGSWGQEGEGEIGRSESNLTAAERRVRAGQIRDAAFANGMTEGWLLAGIADAETGMSHCWSELTWACQGPASPDCGGGPVVAGAGDGPCSLMQGGLGMFQFDAGTFDDTLAREGERILYIDGNVAAAVDFVVGMVIRSAYVPGVDNRDQAIDWMNGVRVGNDRWDPWIRTVTHYYNGCAPTYSCWTSRYAHYRDNTQGVYSEMGPEFWETATEWGAQFVSQSFPFAAETYLLPGGTEDSGYIEMRNTGTQTWTPATTRLGTTEPRDVASPLAASDWISPTRAAAIDRVVAPGETGRFVFSVRAPNEIGEYPQFFTLVEEGVAWFSDQGGPADNQLQIRVTVEEAAPACPAGSERWTCEGPVRVRCVGGAEERERCPNGCEPSTTSDALCLDEPIDFDNDGYYSNEDCDDYDPDRNPREAEICGDSVDQNCDGVDEACVPGADGGGADGGVGPDDRPSLRSGCSVSSGVLGSDRGSDRGSDLGSDRGGAAASWLLALFPLLALGFRRRQR